MKPTSLVSVIDTPPEHLDTSNQIEEVKQDEVELYIESDEHSS